MNPNVRTVAAALSAAAFFATGAYAEEKEPLAVFEIGGAGNWTAPNMSSAGPTVAVEFTPIKDWLEIEIGTGPCLPPGQRIGVPTSSSKSRSTFGYRGTYGRSWPRFRFDFRWDNDGRSRDCARFYFLALAGSKVWLVP